MKVSKEQIRKVVRGAIVEVAAVGPPLHATTFGMMAGAASDRAVDTISALLSSETCERCVELLARIEETHRVREEDQRRRDELDRWPGAGAG